MQQSKVDREDRGGGTRRERSPVTVLTGLPRPARVVLVAMVVAVVAFGSLSQAGVLSPQFSASGSGSGSGSGGEWAWAVLRNETLREWQVTAVDVTHEGGGSVDVVAFPGPADTSSRTLPDDLQARARSPVMTKLPLTVQPGDDLVVFGWRTVRPCVRMAFPDGQPRPTQIAVRIATPLGQRTVSTPLFIEPCRV